MDPQWLASKWRLERPTQRSHSVVLPRCACSQRGEAGVHAYLFNATDNRIFPEGGGLLIRASDGEVVGAVGVTGDTEERDEELAAFGIRAAGLKTDEDCVGMGRGVNVRQTK
ncbi:MAG: heme-binding protein [Bradyrhizobium sp.]